MRKGRPLMPRTDTQRLDCIEGLLGPARKKGVVSIFWDGNQVYITAGEDLGEHSEVASGFDVRRALDQAHSKRGK